MQEAENRRRHPRFQITTGGIATLNGTMLGPLIDISRAGLAFHYIEYGATPAKHNPLQYQVAGHRSPYPGKQGAASLPGPLPMAGRHGWPQVDLAGRRTWDEGDGTAGPPAVSIIHKAGFFLQDIACRIIADGLARPEYHFNPLRKNRCCLQFVGLTAEQEAQLAYFIANFTSTAARRPDRPGVLTLPPGG